MISVRSSRTAKGSAEPVIKPGSKVGDALAVKRWLALFWSSRESDIETLHFEKEQQGIKQPEYQYRGVEVME